MTDLEFTGWLEKGGVRAALIEVDTDTPHYISTVPYTTLPTDTPANLPYLPVVAPSFSFSEKLSLDGGFNISVGSIELYNEDGSLDSWLNEVWVNRAIRVYIGGVSWVRSDFRMIFSGVISELSASSRTRLSIVLRDKLQRLNTPVTDAVLGGTTSNKDRILPITLGECHNVSPLLVNPQEHEYQWHIGEAERLIEVRDNGVPVSTTVTLSTGKFKLIASPAGQITASVQGYSPYANDAASLIKIAATTYGTPSERFTLSDIDLDNFNAFTATCPQPLGVFLGDRANVLQVCQELAESVGAQVVMSRGGLLRLVRIDLDSLSSPREIFPKDYEYGSLSISERSEVVSGIRLGYCKNWTIQQQLESGIPSEHRDLYEQEWLSASSRDSAVATEYKLYADVPQTDTLLLKEIDAQAEADRRLNLWKSQRNVYKVNAYANMLTLELGQAVILYGARFGLDAGKQGMVVGLQSDWVTGRVTVEVLT